MTSDLKTLISKTQAAFSLDPQKAKATFTSSSALIEGFQTEAKLRGHRITVDEPESFGGSDAGPNPVELILAAVGTCQEITYRAYATALGIPLEDVGVEVEGDIDLRGFFGVDENVRPGFEAIRGKVHLVSNAPSEEIEKLRQAVNAHCPVLDIIANQVPIELSVEHETKLKVA